MKFLTLETTDGDQIILNAECILTAVQEKAGGITITTKILTLRFGKVLGDDGDKHYASENMRYTVTGNLPDLISKLDAD